MLTRAGAYATQINANCRCEAIQGGACPIGQTHLRWTYTSGGQSSYWDGCTGFCNPMNCSNSACSNKGCANARTQFCLQHGKPCPDGCIPGVTPGCVRKCYINGADPCKAVCNKTTDDAVNKVIDYIISLCHPNCGNCIFERDFMNGTLKTGWASGLESIRRSLCTGENISGMTQAAFIKYLGDRFRCSFISDKTFANCRGGCPGGTCNGKTCASPKHLNANTCNCDDDVDPITKWFQSSCHIFDFLPWGGCQKETQTVVFGGAIVLGIVLIFTILKR